MDCSEEVLSEAQSSGQSKAQISFKEQMAKLEEIAKKGAAMQRHENGSVTLRSAWGIFPSKKQIYHFRQKRTRRFLYLIQIFTSQNLPKKKYLKKKSEN